jgi:hypothetical protein
MVGKAMLMAVASSVEIPEPSTLTAMRYRRVPAKRLPVPGRSEKRS